MLDSESLYLIAATVVGTSTAGMNGRCAIVKCARQHFLAAPATSSMAKVDPVVRLGKVRC